MSLAESGQCILSWDVKDGERDPQKEPGSRVWQAGKRTALHL